MKHALYGASLDLMTIGHYCVIRQASKMADRLTIAVADNSDKKYMFSTAERLDMAAAVCADAGLKNVDLMVLERDQLLVHAASERGIRYVVRGIRNVNDFVYEQAMQQVNADIAPEVETVFLFPPAHLVKVSSSVVKGLLGKKGWKDIVAKYVPQRVFEKLLIRERLMAS